MEEEIFDHIEYEFFREIQIELRDKKLENMKISDLIKNSQEFDQRNKNLIKNEGVVFTDQEICNQIIDIIDPKITETICEPSVGKGVFVFSLLERFRKNGESVEDITYFIENKLFCYDINSSFIEEFKIILVEYMKMIGYNGYLCLDNIKCGDFLLQNGTWNVILGNPPYVRIQNLNKEYLNILKGDLKSVTLGNVDLYYAFLEKSLKSSDRVGFIIPNSFIKTKSGKFLREIIKDRLSYVYDFCSDKVWEKISTYTCIVICGSKITDTVNYVTRKENVIKRKKDLSDDIWIFLEQKSGSKNISDMINYCSGGLATIKDGIFKMDSDDDDFCYKGKYTVEKDICRKVIKATTDKKFDNYRWILYPYDENSKILNEDVIKNKYPLAYKYLLENRSELDKRDKGKTQRYDSWYAYGRRQGLLRKSNGRIVLLPLTFLRSRGIHLIEVPDDENCLVLSGILVDVKEDSFDLFVDIISSNEFYDYCELNNKILSDKNKSDDVWLSIKSTTLRNFKY